jgi:hypothetical protein
VRERDPGACGRGTEGEEGGEDESVRMWPRLVGFCY